jgi:hypothetical protein
MSKFAKDFFYFMGSSLDLWGQSAGDYPSRIAPHLFSSGFVTDYHSLRRDWYSVGSDIRTVMVADVTKKQGQERESA